MTADLAELEAIKRRHLSSVSGRLEILDAGDDDGAIPPRAWLLGNAFCRRFVSSLTSSGGGGKTTIRIAQALSLAANRMLTGEHIFKRCRVLLVSLEDDLDELRRRVRAARNYHQITPSAVKGWLFLTAPKGIRLADIREGTVQVGALETMLRETIEELRIDLVILDPFVKTHSAAENDNSAIDAVATILTKIAIDCDCAIDAPHHVSKGAAIAGDADKARGASSFRDAARLVYSLTAMTPEEAQGFGVSETERRSLIRVDSAKVNIAPPSAEARWFRLIGVRLGNSTADYPHGDEVQTVEPWTPPDTWAGLSSMTLNEVLSGIDAGLENGHRYSPAGAAGKRAAWPAVQKHCPDKTEAQCREIISTWVKNGVLLIEEYDDPGRREKVKGLRVNDARRPS
jgi:hypothetical protein